ncbi:MAG TPA: OmpH family outer membrane protein [Solimonas sp.]|nr:OmpH family outer membrane protein [Solimonas sp.]
MRTSRHTLTATMLAAASLALSAPAFADVKIATIRASDLVQQSPQFKAGADKMKGEFERRKTDLENDAKKLGEDIKNFQKQADLLSATDRAKQEKDLNTRKIDFDYRQKQFQEDFQNRDRQLTQEMMTKIKTVIEQVAKEKGIDAVIQDPVYSSPAVDITADVLKRLQAAK